MIEAVNAVVANASVLRGAAEQTSSARSFAANPERTQEVIQAPYVSPYIHVDVNYDKAVLQIRDGDTGDVLKQFPSETALALQYREVKARQQQPIQTFTPQEQDIPDVPQQSYTPPQNAQAQVAAAALASTAAQAQAVSAPPSAGNVVVTA